MHRVRAGRRVDPAPEHRVAHGVAEPLRLGPALAVDHHELAARVVRRAVRRLEPEAHDEDPLVRRRPHAGRVDDEPAGELAVDPPVVSHLLAGRRRPVVVRSRPPGHEPYAPFGAGRNQGAVPRRGRMRGEPVDHERGVAQPIPDGRVDDGAFRHPDERPGNLQRLARLPERLHLDAGPVVGVRPEHPHPGLERDRQHAPAEPARGRAVRIGEDPLDRRRYTSRRERGRLPSGPERDQTSRNGDAQVHSRHDSSSCANGCGNLRCDRERGESTGRWWPRQPSLTPRLDPLDGRAAVLHRSAVRLRMMAMGT